MSSEVTIHHGFKGFSKDLTCRDFQFEIGKTYMHDGAVQPCASGFHWCEHPLSVFEFYPPSSSRFCRIEASGDTKQDVNKSASAVLTVTVELNLSKYIQAAVDFVFKAAKWTKKKTTAADREGVSATGYQGAASATGYHGAASATGEYGAASATGYQGAASATGYQGAASATGYQGAAMACGYEGRASGKDDNALFLCERNDEYEIIAVWAGIVGRNGIKADTFYMLRGGVPVEVA